jgi:hypothetical protein
VSRLKKCGDLGSVLFPEDAKYFVHSKQMLINIIYVLIWY